MSKEVIDEVTPLHIALDYDGTYSADPAMWNKFIKIAQAHGHKVTCVTMRKATLSERLDMEIDVIYTNRKGKVGHCEREGVKIDIWIDDSPHWLLGDAA
jgi:hypothetical protein